MQWHDYQCGYSRRRDTAAADHYTHTRLERGRPAEQTALALLPEEAAAPELQAA